MGSSPTASTIEKSEPPSQPPAGVVFLVSAIFSLPMAKPPSLDRERWVRIESILDRVLGLDDETAVAAALVDLCGSDTELQREVEELLRVCWLDNDFLGNPISDGASDLLSELEASLVEEPEAFAGRRIGPYRLLEVLGQGGMGVVYLAERADEQFEQRVAIKLMPRGHETAEMERRLLLERQILANLQHPNIAHLLDGQVTDEGFPYLVMEHIEGRPIDVFCREEGLDLKERLRLFLDVCAAVQYAHQNMVVHRDLKPSNILVTGSGQVKLLDFGIAKLTDTSLDAPAGERTLYQPLTPTYASPEQVSNLPVTTASDVYSLGVVLYQILTGKIPYRLEGLSPSEVEAVIVNRQSAAPSQAVESSAASGIGLEKLRQQLAGDLDTIVLKCLRKTPVRRYGSASELSEDIERYLGGQPIRARPSTWSYRTQRFVRRHRLGVTAAAVIALLLIAGVVGIAWQGRIASLERDKARLEARKAERVAEFLGGLFAAADPTTEGAGQLTVRELLEVGEERVHRELADEPEIRLEMTKLMARSFNSLGQTERASELVDAVIVERREHFPEDELGLARALALRGEIYVATGEYDQAEPLLRRAQELYIENGAGESSDSGMAARHMGNLRSATGRTKLAEQSFREALRIWRLTGEEERAAGEISNLASVLYSQGRIEEALELKQEALGLLTDYYGREHPVVASTRNDVAYNLHRAGDYETAEQLYREALEINEKLLGADSVWVADFLTNLGRLLMDQGRYREAEPYVRRAVTIRQAHNEDTKFERIAAEINLATLQRELGELDESVAGYRSALRRFESLVGPTHNATARVQSLLGLAVHRQGEQEEAEELLRRALETQRSNGIQGITLAETVLGLGIVLCDQGRPAEAEPLLREGLEIRCGSQPADHWQVGEARVELAAALFLLGQRQEAEKNLRSGTQILATSLAPEDWRLRRAEAAKAEFQPEPVIR